MRARIIEAVDVWFQRLLAGLCVLLLSTMLVSVGLQIVMRYGFNSPLIWSEELARFSMIWLAFLAAALAMRHGQHIALTGLFTLPPRTAAVVGALTSAAVVVILLVLVDQGLEITRRTARQTSPALGLPMSYIFAAIPLSAVCMIVGMALAWARRPRSGLPPAGSGT